MRKVITFKKIPPLKNAIFSFTGTRPYNEDEVQQAYTEWIPKLNHALSNHLKNTQLCG